MNFDWHGPNNPKRVGANPTSGGTKGGDPVDLSTGIFVSTVTDAAVRDGLGGLALQRTFRTLSFTSGPFGLSSNHNFGFRLDTITPQTAATFNLIAPDGNRFRFQKQANGTFTLPGSTSTAGAVLTVMPSGVSQLKGRDGSVMQFEPANGPLGSVLTMIIDANGNTTVITRSSANAALIATITDPAGRRLDFAYDAGGRITSVTDPINRTTAYTYTAAGYLATYTDAAGGVTKYEYNALNQLVTVTDPRNIVVIQNQYDTSGRVSRQTLADGGVFSFQYTSANPLVPASPILVTAVTDPLWRPRVSMA